MPKTAVTFVIHGSSREAANVFVRNLIGGEFPSESVNIGFLEVASPTIPEAIEKHLALGYGTVRVIPLFLVPGNHTTKDIPAHIEAVSRKHPHSTIILEDFLGNREEFKELIKKLIF